MQADDATWVPPQDDTPWIASVGHSDHALGDFFRLLQRARVHAVVDVRSRPVSHHTQYSQVEFRDHVQRHGLGYHHLPALGGKRATTYEAHMATATFEDGLGRLKRIAWDALHEGGVASFLCVERDPAQCHRRFIARRLEADGWRVHHILPDTAQARLF